MPVSGVGVAGAGGGGTLQDSYASGESIEVTTANGSFTIVNSADATDTLVVNRTFAGGGSGIDVNMGTGSEAVTGSGLTIDMGGASTGEAFSATLVAGAAGDGVQVNDAGDGTSIFANKTSSNGSALDIQSSGTSVLTVSAIGDFTAASTVGSSEVYEVRLDAAGGAVMRSSIDGTATGSDITIESDAIAAGATASDIIISTITSGGGTAGGVVINAGGVSAPTPSTGAAIVQGGIIVEISAEPASGPNKLTLAAAGVILKGEANVAGPKAADVTVASTQSGAGAGDAGNIQVSSEVTKAGSGDAGDVTVKSEVTGTGTAGIVNILSDANINGTEGGISLEVHSGGAALAVPATGQILLTTGSEVQIDAFNLDINTPLAAVDIDATQILGPDGTGPVPTWSYTTDPTTGTYLVSAGTLGFAISGGTELQLTSTFFAPNSDAGIALGDSSGNKGFNAFYGRISGGVVGTPTYSWVSDTDSGMYRPAINTVGFSTGNFLALRLEGQLGSDTGDEVAFDFAATVDKLTSGDYYGIRLDVDETVGTGPAPASTNKLIDLRTDTGSGMTSRAQINNVGQVLVADGTLALPAFSFIDAPTVGIYRDTDTKIHYNAPGHIFETAGTSRYEMASTVFRPTAGNSRDLGASSQKWKDFYAFTLQMDDGTAGAPSHTFDTEPTMGFYRSGSGVMVWSTASTGRLSFSSSALAPFSGANVDLGSGSTPFRDVRLDGSLLATSDTFDNTVTINDIGIQYGGTENDFEINGATAAVDVNGKAMIITGAAGGVASASAGGIGADVTVRSGFGGAGTAGLAAGAGGDLNLVGRDAGADNGGGGANGGNVVITAGLATGAGVQGQVQLFANGEAVVVDNDSTVPSLRPDSSVWTLGETSFRWNKLYTESGTVAAPAVNVNNVGLFRPAANQLGLAANSEAVIVDNDAATPSLRPDVDDTWTLGEAAIRWADGFFTQTTVGDLNLKGVHDDAHWTINEDRSGLYLHDRRTGKSYRFVVEEVFDAPEPLPMKETA